MDLVRPASEKYRPLIIIGIIFLILVFLGYKLGGNKLEYRELTAEELVELTEQRYEAYQYAVECSRLQPKLTFDQINWHLVPGRRMEVEAIDGRISLAGFFNPTDSTIYMPFTKRDIGWIMSHEAMHAIGVMGHPDEPFRRCGLMADQN